MRVIKWLARSGDYRYKWALLHPEHGHSMASGSANDTAAREQAISRAQKRLAEPPGELYPLGHSKNPIAK